MLLALLADASPFVALLAQVPLMLAAFLWAQGEMPSRPRRRGLRYGRARTRRTR